jgi:hypothetical protein
MVFDVMVAVIIAKYAANENSGPSGPFDRGGEMLYNSPGRTERRAVFDPQRGGPMKQIKFAGRSFLLLAALCLVFPFYSYGYIDPGTGSYVFQIIVAALVAVSFAVKVYWLKIKGFIAGLISKKGK